MYSHIIFLLFKDEKKMLFVNEIGKGSYARVVKASFVDENSADKALKIQKPSCVWEWYISKEIQYRLKDPEKVNICTLYYICYT